jgi:hypothetical protein
LDSNPFYAVILRSEGSEAAEATKNLAYTTQYLNKLILIHSCPENGTAPPFAL